MRVVVVGGGIVGASVAHHLAVGGASVTLLEQALPGSGTTGASFAWIGRAAASTGMRDTSLADWHRLAAEVPALDVTRNGSLVWDSFADGPLADDPRVIEPGLAPDAAPDRAQHRPEDGSVDPVAATETLIGSATANGASVRIGSVVTEVLVHRDRVTGVRTLDGVVEADQVVLANGVGAVPLCARLGVDLPVTASPAVLFTYDAEATGIVRGTVGCDAFEIRQLADGTVVAPTDHRDETTRNDLRASGDAVARELVRAFPGLGRLRLRSGSIGWRPMPTESRVPVIGPVTGVGGLSVAVMHSAVTLAASAGRRVAESLLV